MSLTAAESKISASNLKNTLGWINSQSDQDVNNAQARIEDDLGSIETSEVESSEAETASNSSDTESDEDGSVPNSSDTEANEECSVSNTTSSFGKSLSKWRSENARTTSDPNIVALADLLKAMNSVQTVGNVKVENSTGVHIGNITNINGNIQIIHKGGDGNYKKERRRRKSAKLIEKECLGKTTKAAKNITPVEKEEQVQRDVFIDNLKIKVPKHLCPIIPRHQWLAQVPLEEYEHLETPVKLVIISHTATESSEQQAINIRIIRDTQCFHIESRGWNDIAYNFLIGCDGNVYQGRGWGVVGAHTQGYNNCSVGISFIGCFMRDLPSNAALNACKNFLKRGVDEGHLAVDYKLICHCQCRPTQSPGRKLFEEIKTWEHFFNIQDEDEESGANS